LLKNHFEDLDGSYRAFFTDGSDNADLSSFVDKTKYPASKTGESDNRTDVFDELSSIMRGEENSRAKILFPYYKGDNFWLVGEIVLDKKGQTLSVLVLAHDPYGRGEMSNMKFNVLENRLKEVFVELTVEVLSVISQYTSKRLSLDDIISSGVIVADELVKRIANDSLTLSTAYPVGARQVRENQILFLLEVCDEEVQSYIEKIALEEDDSKVLVLSIKELRYKYNEITNSDDTKEIKLENLQQIENDYYKPLVKQLSQKTSFEESTDLVIVFDDLINLSLSVSDLRNKLEYITEAAVYCQYIKTILEERFSKEQREKILKRHRLNPTQRWNDIQEKFISEIGGIKELLPKMTLDTREYKKKVENLRSEARLGIQSIDERFEHMKTTYPNDMDDHRNSTVKPVRDMFENIAKKMKLFLAQLYNDSEKIMATPPPCQYAVIGLGSLALQQITPYSDFEFAILTELDAHDNSEIINYFTNLSHLANLKMIGLGETIVPTSKFDVDLNDLVHVGINFDLGGKTPLGRADKPYSLIKTVSEMLKYVYNKDDKISHIDKNLPYILENVCYVAGDQELVKNYKQKVSEFLMETNLDHKNNCEARALKILEEGAVEFDYANKQPNLELKTKKFESDLEKLYPALTQEDGKYFNVKLEIYRLSERMVYNMGLYFGIEGESCWDTIDKMNNIGIINDTAQKNLHYAVSFANLLRLKTYSMNKAQTGYMSIHPKNLKYSETTMLELAEEDLEENGELFNYFYRAFPLYRKLEEFCSKQDKLTNSERHHFFQQESFFNNDSTNRGTIYYRLNQYDNALRHLLVALETVSPETRMVMLHTIAEAYISKGDYDSALQCYTECSELEKVFFKAICARTLDQIGAVYNFKGEYEVALQYHYRGLEMNKAIFKGNTNLSVVTSLNNIGLAYISKGDYDSAIQYFKESIDMLKFIFKNVADPSVATALHNLGSACESKGEYDLALQYCRESFEMRKVIFKEMAHPEIAASLKSLGIAYGAKGNYDLGLQYQKECLAMQKIIFKNVAHPEVATTLCNIGLSISQSKKDYDLALQYCRESLEMRRTIYKDVAHPDVVSSLNKMGMINVSKGDYDLALMYYKECIEMNSKIFKGVAHPDVAESMNNIGVAYYSKGEYDLALKYYLDSLAIYKIVYKDIAHRNVGSALNNLGLTYYSKKDYDSAIYYYKKCLESRKEIFKDVAHPETAISLNNIGNALLSIDEYELALQYHQQCLEMRKIIFKNAVHPDLANSLSNVGNVYMRKGQDDLALKYHKECLEMRKAFYKNVPHPDIAKSLTSIGFVYKSKGEYHLALQYLEESLEMLKVIYQDVPHPMLSIVLYSIGDVYESIGEFELAQHYFTESIRNKELSLSSRVNFSDFKFIVRPAISD
jgi:tetratricopeptide (TPR) repeat protein